MDISEFADKFREKMKEITDFIGSDDAKDIVGTEAVNHFKESFANEGFTDENLEPWPEVERRKKDSEWFGHSGQTGKFSEARTMAKILTGETNELREATKYEKTGKGVKVKNEKKYARVHQFGGMAKIYGKKEFQMLARPFIGKSKVMVDKIKDELKSRIKDILKK
jgi:phage gpG-like protein